MDWLDDAVRPGRQEAVEQVVAIDRVCFRAANAIPFARGSEEAAMAHQFFIRQQNLKLYRSLMAASEAAAAKADARQEKYLKLLAEEVANEPPPRKN